MHFLSIFIKKGVANKKSFPYIARLAEGNLSGRQGLLGRPFVLEKSIAYFQLFDIVNIGKRDAGGVEL